MAEQSARGSAAAVRAPESAELTSPAQPEPRSSLLPPLVSAAAYLLFWQIAPRVRADSLGAVLCSTVISLALSVWFPAAFVRAVRNGRALAICFAAATVISLPLRAMGAQPIPPWSFVHAVPGLSGLLFIWFAACIGALLSRILRGANLIPPVAAVLALVDIWTVLLGGPVQKVLQSDSPAAALARSAMMVDLPPVRATTGAAPLHLGVGFADFLFIAFFVAAVSRFMPGERAYRRTLWPLIGALCGYMALVVVTDWSLPALVPMAVVMIAVHWRRFHYQRSEAFALIYAAVFIAVIAGGFWWFGRSRGGGEAGGAQRNPEVVPRAQNAPAKEWMPAARAHRESAA